MQPSNQKTAKPHEMVGFSHYLEAHPEIAEIRGYRIVRKNSLEIGVDTLTTTANKSALKTYCDTNGFLSKKIESHSKISANVKRTLFDREYTNQHQIITPSGYKNLITRCNTTLNRLSDHKKAELIAFGLASRKSPLHVNMMVDEVTGLFNRFGVESFDLCIDAYQPIQEERLKPFGKVEQYLSTLYINEPLRTVYITKMKLYDKAAKDKLSYNLWRLELTIQTKGKLQNMFIPTDEIKSIIDYIWR